VVAVGARRGVDADEGGGHEDAECRGPAQHQPRAKRQGTSTHRLTHPVNSRAHERCE
jgi:hypothetical protein